MAIVAAYILIICILYRVLSP
ncbi:hypothetical protein PBI_MRMAGOO_94 [Mycobacterium phage MrMagoo]|uniref:Uncharacterized protein n=1 Tax=Mycobacterium phage MrMagoo TaxID=1927020 RepID=A0A1L6BYM0_9CAUD|nr:hypothetical protein J4U04_gp094 [Mycobacterium phage MrMagoo]APQ42197.1 hypothetical protein PBI_MRMAGOO_94 [Mycobacterium phage MrMagoo]